MTDRRECTGNFAQRDRLLKMPKVWLLVGLPLCGKSTWANRNYGRLGATIVSADDIRRALGVEWDKRLEPVVWRMFNLMVKALLARGQNLIIDSTNHTVARRKQFVQMADRHEIELRIVSFEDPLEVEWQSRCARFNYPWDVVRQLRRDREHLTEHERRCVVEEA